MIVILFLAIATHGLAKVQAVGSTKRLQMGVFYESLCPDTRDFFVKQLRPVIRALGSHIDLRLVPYGKGMTQVFPDGRIASTCQHGEQECYGNRIHGCALAQYAGALTSAKVLFAACLFDEFSTPLDIGGEKCSKMAGFNWTDIRTCANSHQGSALQYNYGIQTLALNPPLTFVPTIVINKSQGDPDVQKLRLKNLKFAVCQELKSKMKDLPSACSIYWKAPTYSKAPQARQYRTLRFS